MNREIFYLSTCDTCKRIMKETGIGDEFEAHDIKFDKITNAQIEKMRSLSGSYESLLSRKARKFKEMGLKDRELSEEDIKQLILEEYTFLKRPVVIIGDRVFIGNSAKNVADLKDYLLKN